MTAQVSIGSLRGDVLRRFMPGGTMAVVAGGAGDGVGGGAGPHGPQAPIHSGHFMVSCVHEDFDDAAAPGDDEGPDDDDDEGKRGGDDDGPGYNFENASTVPSDSYKFGVRSTNQLSIDASLTRLFNHMTLAYSGKITSPKWKNFKGIKVKLKDKIRLNNIIWREWHMQYIKRQKPIVCQFEAPISERTHSRPEAVVLEGKYWKRRLQCLTTEYKKWRLFYKNRVSKVQKVSRSMEELDDLHSLLGNYERLGAQFPPIKLFDEQMAIEDDYLSTFANDTLFSSLNPPFAFPDAREISQYGFGDIIQPNLIQLQPSLDESMDTLAPLPVVNEFRDFSQGPGERNYSRKAANGGLIDILFGDAYFPDETSQQESSINKLDLQSPNTSKDEYLINQLQQQLMDTSTLSPDCCLDLFINENDKPPTGASNVVMTSLEDPFFSSGLCADRLGIPTEQEQRTSDQQQNSNAGMLDVGYLRGVNNQQMRTPGEFVADAVDMPAVPQDLERALFQPFPGGNMHQAVTVVPNSTPSQSRAVSSLVPQKPWPHPPSQLPSNPSANGGLKQRNLTGPAAIPSCLQNDVDNKTCRRGSTGSLQPAKESSGSLRPAKGKKHVTFLCPQPLTAPSTSKPKQRHLNSGSSFCDNVATKAPDGLANLSKGKTVRCTDQQNRTILAQLLTQGKTTSGPFLPPAATARSNWNAPNAIAHAATKEIQTTINPQSSLRFPINSASLTTAAKTLKVSIPQHLPGSQPSSYSDFHKSMLSAAVGQALGVETQDAHRVTASIFNNVLSRVMNNMQSSAPPGVVLVSPPHSNESAESANDEDIQTSDNSRENRRVHHLSAEQKRRSSIKNGFETLNQLVPELCVLSLGKINKAATLQKAAECCRRLKSERQTKLGEMERLRHQIDELQAEISSCQAKLPATGVPVVRPQTNQSKALFQDYVRNRTLANWKFWIFSFLIRPLFDSYDEGVVMTSYETFCQSVLTWMQQHCSLVALRPAVLKALRELSTTTSILVDPSNMPQEATEAVSGQSSFTH